MRPHPVPAATVFAAIVIAALSGCSSGDDSTPSSTSKSAAASTTSETHTAAPGATEVSPGGVTTAVGAPAESTEEEYAKACEVAKTWMGQQGGDLTSQLEPYLKTLQASDSTGAATFGTPWSQLTPGRQAAVIVAAQAAAQSLCG